MQICELKDVRKDYRMGELVTPLKEVSLTVDEGEFIAVEGPSGVGKSTLLYVMGMLLQSDGGSYRFAGKEVSALSDRERSALRAERIGFLFQDTTLIQALTLRENLIFASGVGGKREQARSRADALLARFGLADRADYLPYQLSGGQRRRLMAARCLIHRPSLILADEPTNDLDDHWSMEIMELFREEAARGAGVVMVTHNSRWADFAAARYRLGAGKLTKRTEENEDEQA